MTTIVQLVLTIENPYSTWGIQNNFLDLCLSMKMIFKKGEIIENQKTLNSEAHLPDELCSSKKDKREQICFHKLKVRNLERNLRKIQKSSKK